MSASARICGHVWDDAYAKRLDVDQLDEGHVRVTLSTDGDALDLTLAPERVRELRLLLGRIERN